MRPDDSELVTFDDVACLQHTPLAILVTLDGDEHWIPRRVIDDASEVQDVEDTGTLILPEWFALEKGLI